MQEYTFTTFDGPVTVNLTDEEIQLAHLVISDEPDAAAAISELCNEFNVDFVRATGAVRYAREHPETMQPHDPTTKK